MSKTLSTQLAYGVSKLGLVLIALGTLSGCIVHTRGHARTTASASVTYSTPEVVVVQSEPPAAQATVHVQPARPAASYVWIDGYWDWQGRWVWVEGRWSQPAQAGWVWEAPVVVVEGGRRRYHRGHWRPARKEPPRAYRRPDRVRVSARPRATATVRVQGSARAQAGRPQPARTTQQPSTPRGRSSVRVEGRAEAPRATVQVRGQGSARTTTQAPRATAQPTRATAQPPRATVQAPRHGAQVQGQARAGATVQTPSHSAAVRGNAAARQPAARATVQSPSRSAAVRNQPPQRATVQAPSAAQGVRNQPAQRQPAQPQPAPGRVGERQTQGQAASARPPLSCSVGGEAVAGGTIRIAGRGFSSRPQVKIGGRGVNVENFNASSITVRVPQGQRSGVVEVRVGQERAQCGSVNVERVPPPDRDTPRGQQGRGRGRGR